MAGRLGNSRLRTRRRRIGGRGASGDVWRSDEAYRGDVHCWGIQVWLQLRAEGRPGVSVIDATFHPRRAITSDELDEGWHYEPTMPGFTVLYILRWSGPSDSMLTELTSLNPTKVAIRVRILFRKFL